jgi:hypothetical protein
MPLDYEPRHVAALNLFPLNRTSDLRTIEPDIIRTVLCVRNGMKISDRSQFFVSVHFGFALSFFRVPERIPVFSGGIDHLLLAARYRSACLGCNAEREDLPHSEHDRRPWSDAR